jgi:uncharacterized membrane protein
MKKSFLTGIAILLPIAITIWVIDFFFNLLTKPFLFIAQSVLDDFGLIPDDHPVFLFIARIGILCLLVVVTLGLGYVAQKFFFSYIIDQVRKFLKRIPIIKTVYQITEQTIDSFISNKKNPFSEVVTIQFPGSETTTIAFLTGQTSKKIVEKAPKFDQAVFVPTAPHPISGFLLFAPKEAICKVDIDPEDAFKILFSCGTFDPSETIKDT